MELFFRKSKILFKKVIYLATVLNNKVNVRIMKRTILLIGFLFVTALLFGKVKGVKHVVLIGLDGWGAYSVPQADMPTVRIMMKGRSLYLESRSVLPSSSACNWASR